MSWTNEVFRCWKLHFIYNINKEKLLDANYDCWFKNHKYYISDKFLIPVSQNANYFIIKYLIK